LLLHGFACRVPGAAQSVPHRAGPSFSEAGLPQVWVRYQPADALIDRALELMDNSADLVCINPLVSAQAPAPVFQCTMARMSG
jgi:hypothetical protein